ncbi:MAG TPA: type IV pilus twitching motility protein PilT [Candidatus Mcinerneyibacteriales bacterium]|jgi:twitching motility protein PilT|nr:type IV pilus twitching motility protein PilT [Candidatus Mcinerneyibacteriales bacterium]HPE19962.1 type IV pilus twitching motility protein PilT [Candidatus Mcinerneyibacteriales bacterium]HPJ70457.1 type IV pilus twitching motility protein PilT [Candidatus Mcinerneyibacteriales bacterium]
MDFNDDKSGLSSGSSLRNETNSFSAPTTKINVTELFKYMQQRGASDLHITVGKPPVVRVDGTLQEIPNMPILSPQHTQALVYSILTDAQKKQFEETNELDFSFSVKGVSRFRGNVFRQRGAVGMAVRTIPFEIKPFEQLGLPPVLKDLCNRPNGLVLVTGPTGSGKSTTLAAMVDFINEHTKAHIMTIEDPIEFVHRHNNSVINQREVGTDTSSFEIALKHVLRQDPDVILIGELRDIESMRIALKIAETGHLCLASLHTNSAAQTISRIVDIFPGHEKQQVRTQLSFVLEGVVSQQLIPSSRGGRIIAYEILVATPAIRNLIREDKVQQIVSHMQTGQKYGMTTLNAMLYKLYTERYISYEDAVKRSPAPEELINKINTRT